MTPEQYAASQAAITAGLAAYTRRLASLFTGPTLSARDWLELLRLLFPEVQRRYEQSASLGRDFYDSQRRQYHPDLDRNERFLSEIKFEWFVQNMEPTRREMSRADSPPIAATKVALAAVREVEMAARRQVIGSVKNDPVLEARVDEISDPPEVVTNSEFKKPSAAVKAAREKAQNASEPGSDLLKQVEEALAVRALKVVRDESYEDEPDVEPEFPTSGAVIGWARVATGRETCAWCLMLISRGAELNHKGNFAYAEAATAGINLDDETALDLWEEAGGNIDKFKELLYDEDQEDDTYMEKWHVGCDCLAVPVFDIENWPGKDQAQRALELWIDASKEASQLIKDGEARTNNKARETLNALRRRLERGDISMSTYALAA